MEQKQPGTLAVDAIINNISTKDIKYVIIPSEKDGDYLTLDLSVKADLLLLIEYLNLK